MIRVNLDALFVLGVTFVFLFGAYVAWQAGDTQSAKEAMYILSGFLVGYGVGIAYANRERGNTP
jgi:hypothetical protein